MQIAIDGPSGVGKSTVARSLSKKLNIDYLDTGSMYRAIALKVENSGFYDFENKNKVDLFFKNTKLNIEGNRIYLDGKDVEDLIRNEETGMLASKISSFSMIRDHLVAIQQNIASKKSIIMDGRDIGTVVLKNSSYKYYLDASADVRARRRQKQLAEKSIYKDINEILESIQARDLLDKTRKNSPLKISEGALYIDTDKLSIDDVISLIIKDINKKTNKNNYIGNI